MPARKVQALLRGVADPEIAEHSKRFFKAGKGGYGEGDRFLGIRVPVLRKLVKEQSRLTIRAVLILLKSAFHEERLFALLWLTNRFAVGETDERAEIFRLYLDNTKYINNWDLVDSSAHLIVGRALENLNRAPIYRLAKSGSLWERRIAIISTFWFIKRDDFFDAFKVAGILLNDSEDLIHKAVGWMLREIGKRDIDAEKEFLSGKYKKMPRTMLRYAIERFPGRQRMKYLAGYV